ncbi:MAG: hypothetical protein ACE5QF_02650 [Thermoplasmata archaeon]
MSGSRSWKDLGRLLAVTLAVGTLLVDVAYWAAAVDISPSGSCDNWPCSPAGRYLPWPWKPEVCAPVVTPMDAVDSAICQLAKTGLIVPLIAGDVALLAWIGHRLGRIVEPKRKRDHD